MPQRSDTLETTLLALEILRHIPRKHKITAKELQQKLQCAGIKRDLRSVQRLMAALSDSAALGIERDDRSKPYGFRWQEQARGMALGQLTLHESLLLQLAQEHLKHLLPVHLMQSMDGFFAQARRNLDGQSPNERLARQWPSKVRVVATSQPLLPPAIAPGVLEEVSEALYANRWLELDYQNAAGKRQQAKVMPLGLAQQGPRLYLVCRFEDFDDERSLALHRIRKAQASTLGFDRPPEFDLAQYDADGRFGFGYGEQVHLTFEIETEAGFHLTETPLSRDQQVQALDADWMQITATVVDSAMLQWWLRGFGEAVRNIRKTAVES